MVNGNESRSVVVQLHCFLLGSLIRIFDGIPPSSHPVLFSLYYRKRNGFQKAIFSLHLLSRKVMEYPIDPIPFHHTLRVFCIPRLCTLLRYILCYTMLAYTHRPKTHASDSLIFDANISGDFQGTGYLVKGSISCLLCVRRVRDSPALNFYV